jgi:release factor glutamine methyltransferase
MPAFLPASLTIAQARRALAATFRDAGIDTPEVDARILVGHALGLDHAALTTRGDMLLGAADIRHIENLASRRLAREPVARILGHQEFWSLPLAVTPAVLVPRPETETVVELALDQLGSARRGERLRILDIGTGSGALLLALLTELQQACGTGTDISTAALAVARDNAAALALAARTHFLATRFADGLAGPFDLIVSNPPYIAAADIAGLEPEVRSYDPRLALDGGPDGLDCYRAIVTDAARLLAPGGRLVLELGVGQADAVAALIDAAGLTLAAAPRRDLAGIPRAIASGPKSPDPHC